MVKFEMENFKIKLTEKQQKYQSYHQVKSVNVNILQAQKY